MTDKLLSLAKGQAVVVEPSEIPRGYAYHVTQRCFDQLWKEADQCLPNWRVLDILWEYRFPRDQFQMSDEWRRRKRPLPSERGYGRR